MRIPTSRVSASEIVIIIGAIASLRQAITLHGSTLSTQISLSPLKVYRCSSPPSPLVEDGLSINFDNHELALNSSNGISVAMNKVGSTSWPGRVE